MSGPRDRLDGAFLRVAAAWRRTSHIGQQSFDDVFQTHPDLTDPDTAHRRRPEDPSDRCGY